MENPNILDAEYVTLVRETLRSILLSSTQEEMPRLLLDNGWLTLLEDDPWSAVPELFEMQGSMRVATPALDLVALHSAGLPVEADLAFLHPLPESRPYGLPGKQHQGQIDFDGIALAGLKRATMLVIPTANSESEAALREGSFAIVDAKEVSLSPITGMDPELGLTRVTGTLTPLHLQLADSEVLMRCFFSQQLALSYELLGTAGALYSLSEAQVIDREVYGQPLGSLQVVRHRVAEMVVAMHATRRVLHDLSGVGDTLAGWAAKASAGGAALLVARHAQQLAGALGFTEESPIPNLIRRVQVLDVLYGSSARLQVLIGEELMKTKVIPRPRGLSESA